MNDKKILEKYLLCNGLDDAIEVLQELDSYKRDCLLSVLLNIYVKEKFKTNIAQQEHIEKTWLSCGFKGMRSYLEDRYMFEEEDIEAMKCSMLLSKYLDERLWLTDIEEKENT